MTMSPCYGRPSPHIRFLENDAVLIEHGADRIGLAGICPVVGREKVYAAIEDADYRIVINHVRPTSRMKRRAMARTCTCAAIRTAAKCGFLSGAPSSPTRSPANNTKPGATRTAARASIPAAASASNPAPPRKSGSSAGRR